MKKFITIATATILLNSGVSLAQIPELKTTMSGGKFYEAALFKKGEINKSFYFIRHGQTDENKYKVTPENLDVPLNEEGKVQAQKAAKILKNKNIKVIIASTFTRAKETAAIINQELNVPIIYVDGLKEANSGLVKGDDIRHNEKIKIWRNGGEVKGAESLYLFQKRIHSTIKEVINKYDDVLIVSHGSYFWNLTILLNGEAIDTKNAAPYLFSPFSGNQGKELYKITPLT